MSGGGGADVPSRLLYAVAKGREEAVSLAVQLAEKSEECVRERTEGDRLRVLVERVEGMRVEAAEDSAAAHRGACDADARAATARVDAEEAVVAAHEDAAHAHAAADEAEARAEALQHDLSREKERGAQLGRALEEAEAAVAQDLEGLRHEMDAAIEATTMEAQAGKDAAVAQADAARRRVAQLESEISAVRNMSDAAAAASRVTEAAGERRRVEGEAETTRHREHCAALEDEASNLTAQIEAFAVVNSRLQDAATSAQTRADAEAAKVGRGAGSPCFDPGLNLIAINA